VSDDRVPTPLPRAVSLVPDARRAVSETGLQYSCTNRNSRIQWDTLTHCKTRVLELVWAPTASIGVKLSAIKFMQRVILVQTRGASDPRVLSTASAHALPLTVCHATQLQNKQDPNLSSCPADHPFISVPTLEAEGTKLLESVITLLYTSQ
jgi:symplekin